MKYLVRCIQLSLIMLVCGAQTCESTTDPVPPENPEPLSRSYRMGFSAIPPRLETVAVLQTVDSFLPRADATMLLLNMPWRDMLQGASARTIVREHELELVQLYRSRGITRITAMVDPVNGLARDRESDELLALGRSIHEPEIQTLYREYLMAVDSILHPTELALAMETNLVRAVAPREIYDAIVVMTNATAAALRASGTAAKLGVTVQVETAWGRLPLTDHFRGVAEDLHDFPFIQTLGLSAYPFLGGFTQPEDVPIDYYSRVSSGVPLPIFVAEGGWSSGSIEGIFSSTPEKQARWITRQMQLADQAHLAAIFPIAFTDIDLSSFGGPANLSLFSQLGLVDTQFRHKPALAEWDAAFRRPYSGS